MDDHSQARPHLVVCMDVLHVNHCLLRSPKQIHRLPKKHTIKKVCVASMDSKSIWAYSRCLVNLSGLFLVNKTAFDHPPADGSLKSTQAE